MPYFGIYVPIHHYLYITYRITYHVTLVSSGPLILNNYFCTVTNDACIVSTNNKKNNILYDLL